MMRNLLLVAAMSAVAFVPVAAAGCAADTICTDNNSFEYGDECGAPEDWGGRSEWSSLRVRAAGAEVGATSGEDCYSYMGDGSGFYSLSVYAFTDAQNAWVSYSETDTYNASPDPASQCAASASTWGAHNDFAFTEVGAPLCGNVPRAHWTALP